MPKTNKQSDIYSSARNPPRLAKSVPQSEPVDNKSLVVPSQPRPILPMKPYTPRQTSTEEEQVPPPPAKRGRKPGPLSRAAREAQRRLNHSIIEKARRTKINEALATLKRLVPADYGQHKQPPGELREGDDDSEDDDDYEEGNQKKVKSKSKATGKKEEKEKEFKLEILVRTVTFLQDLLERVKTMEAAASAAPASQTLTCSNCKGGTEPTKRKRSPTELVVDEHKEDDAYTVRHTKRSRTNTASADVFRSSTESDPEPFNCSTQQSAATADRLPSISSWLHESEDIDHHRISPLPRAKPPHHSSSSPMQSYLPSPPSSTQFDPIRSSTIPPHLSLGPVATAALVTPGNSSSTSNNNINRTPEDESAATSLLQIASSPPFLPVLSTTKTTPLLPKFNLADPPNFSLHRELKPHKEGRTRQAQTPSSILGMNPMLF